MSNFAFWLRVVGAFSLMALALVAGALLGRRSEKWVDPIGWDESAQAVHDVSLMPDGKLMHHSTCWCRNPKATP